MNRPYTEKAPSFPRRRESSRLNVPGTTSPIAVVRATGFPACAGNDTLLWRRACLLVIALALPGCEREIRSFQPAPSAELVEFTRLTEFQAGAGHPVDPVERPAPFEYEENAFAINEGKRLYSSFNCVGCHAHGGGDIGPPLMDAQWIYGGTPEQIFGTIVEGRPNGMPAWGGRIPEYQIWQLVAYVRSMSGQVSEDAAPGREDDAQAVPPENSRDPEGPIPSSVPPASVSTQ